MQRDQETESDRLSYLRAAAEAIYPLHGPIRPAGEDDWLSHHDEPGQTFEEYQETRASRPTGKKPTLDVLPLGRFSPIQQRTLEATSELLGLFYGLPVRTLEPMELEGVPPAARRPHPYEGEQILTKWILQLLRRRKSSQCVALLALASADLWPGDGWNFVFGQASLRHGVGVWSLYRLGSPEKKPEQFLRRTLKIAVHETGHMFGIRHCIVHECGMNGANHLDEADTQPIWFCPEDELKIWWACGIDPAARYDRLAGFAGAHGLDREAQFWKASKQAVSTLGS